MKLRRERFFILSYDKKTAIRASIIISFILAFVMLSSSMYYAISLDKKSGLQMVDIITPESIVTLLINTLFFYFLFRVQFWAVTHFLHRPHKMWLLLSSLFVVIIFLSPLFSKMQWWWFRDQVSTGAYSTLHYVKDLIILIISFLFTLLIYFINQNQKRVTENQHLVFENLQNRYSALKNQADPHFLFNSLNTLNGLIGYDDQRARDYVEQLSRVFRYTMQNREIARLSDELEFAESYIYLMKIRYDDGLDVQIHIDNEKKNYYMIPSGLQLLIENAIKHNVVSRKNPLRIVIETLPDDKVRVENNLQIKTGERVSNGLGLSNLNELYRLMFGKEITVCSAGGMFSVEVPLIKDVGLCQHK
ncbi:sensor histidine kinase [Proteiniphilum sp. UBA1028]|jgi:sensor histidine kinase YesM|uniref:sensor histidine kinase n=1 Tax=Proteiniphilum sp. UBA1028 TaxID=1947251 RepID=UPI000E80C071|nr:histidine kinase [Proteiniphilum sp. UBA1028]HBG57674.1 histidine kinase [Porphyromonadaceae bacterium]